ncbi:hypothetical protein NI17_009535 [Thermobifida halotolerans]|uniref:Uncharacterized protein n=1 Tax=Thermobifida halotolerans TaxID=483545 RepID=A0A399FZL5_9ACTN|nr:hypothetical protein [Thermobifida halotolerans]UOE21338.1 hypothetical protein NI17_009535 [Thermobifida halotolerans]
MAGSARFGPDTPPTTVVHDILEEVSNQIVGEDVGRYDDARERRADQRQADRRIRRIWDLKRNVDPRDREGMIARELERELRVLRAS